MVEAPRISSPRRLDVPPDGIRSLPGPGLEPISLDPLCAEPHLADLDSWVTPTDRFFIRGHFPIPQIDRSTWRLSIGGLVGRPCTLRYEDLRQGPTFEQVVTMECAGNSRSAIAPRPRGVRWDHGAVGNARWSGIPLAEVLQHAGGPAPGARYVVLEGADHGMEEEVPEEIHYAMSLPLEKALDPGTLIAFEMNGEPLTAAHGFPARAIVPDWYGMASVKWIHRIEVLDHEFEGFFRTGSYVYIPEGEPLEGAKTPVTELQVKSLITWPPEGSRLAAGPHVVRGVAWSGGSPISKVELSTAPPGELANPSSWSEARLLPPRERHAWVRWEWPTLLDRSGYLVLRARATDERGSVQPLHARWNYRGVATNSIHPVTILVGSSD